MIDLENLAPPDPNWQTGAIYREPRITDFQLANDAGVQDALAAGLPPTAAVLEDEEIEVIYSQEGPSCTAYSDCTVKSIHEFLDIRQWLTFDGLELYRACGGDGVHGIPADRSLSYLREIGAREMATGKRFKIDAYAFAPRARYAWRETVAAAISTKRPLVIATLLPENFGYHSSGRLTSAYHQLCATRYTGLRDDDYLHGPNTWTRSFGQNGFYGLTWGMLEDGGDFQDKHVYAWTLVDHDDPEPAPDPNAQPLILQVKRKKHKAKYLVWVSNASADARLFVDSELTDVGLDGERFVLRKDMEPGPHFATVVNGNGKSSLPVEFQVKA